MAMNFGPQWMRKIPVNVDVAGRTSPALPSPSTPTHSGAHTMWGSSTTGAPGSINKPTTPTVGSYSENNHANGSGPWSAASLAQSALPTSTEPNPYRYSREFILSLFDPKLPAPDDFDPTGPCSVAVAAEILPPMANLPLNDHEKKLFTMPSVNSDVSARRPPYGRSESKDGVSRPPRAPGQPNRSYSTRMERAPSGQYESPRRGRTMHEGEYEDLWDTPASVGSFTGNGTFNTPDEENRSSKSEKQPGMLLGGPTGGRESPTPIRTASPASFHEDRTLQAASPPKQAPAPLHMPSPSRQTISAVGERLSAATSPGSGDLATSTFSNPSPNPLPKSSSFVDIYNPFASTTLAGNVASVGSPTVKHEVLGGVERRHTPDPIGARSSSAKPDFQAPGHVAIPPGIGGGGPITPFVAPKWQYKDPTGLVQGPFPATQMHDWYKLGYFTDDLPVKRTEDYNYEPLATLVRKYGRDRPFLTDAEELERLHHLQNEQRRMNSLPVGGTPGGLRDLYGDNNQAGLGFNPFGGFGGAGAPVGGVGFNQGLGGDVFGGIGRDIGQGFGPDSLGGAPYGRTGWGDHGVGRGGWNALNPESPFVRSGLPASPSTSSLQGQYFDQRVSQTIPQQSYIGGIMAQQQSSPFGIGAGPQTPGVQGTTAANLFSAPPLFDSFGATQAATPSVQTPRQQDWPAYPLEADNNVLGSTAGVFPDEGHGHIDDVVSKLIEDASPVQDFPPESSIARIDEAVRKQQELEQQQKQQQQVTFDQELVDRLQSLTTAEAPSVHADAAPQKLAAVEEISPVATSPVAKKEEKKKARKEERKLKEQDKVAHEEQKLAAPLAAAPPTPSSTPAVPAVDLRAIMVQEEERSKKEKEAKAIAKAKELEKEVEEAQRQQQQKTRGGSSVWAAPAPKAAETAPKLSLKEIQEIEQKEREEKERERQKRAHQMLLLQAQQIQEAEAAAAAAGQWSGRSSETGGPGVWGAAPKPAISRGKSLSEIMQEEETRKKKDGEGKVADVAATVAAAVGSGGAGGAGVGGVSVGGGKRYADSVGVLQGGAAAWGLPSASARGSVTRAPAVVATGPVVKAGPAGVEGGAGAAAAAGSPGGEAVKGAWNVVGKQGQAIRPAPVRPAPVPAAPRPVTVPVRSVQMPSAPVISAPVGPISDGSKGPSDAFLNWCRAALRPLERSTTSGVNVEDFIGILLSIPATDSGTTQMICDDTLGGLTAIDPRKFADEFMKRRRADASGVGVESLNGAGGASGTGLESFESANKFVVVGKGAKKKKSRKV
ncbi:hypothetical protein HDV00_005096 [Rhizophlyctis rosea]|nr:hypothetical protein HDV00_005096 [Rhizophlyctis rosea]